MADITVLVGLAVLLIILSSIYLWFQSRNAERCRDMWPPGPPLEDAQAGHNQEIKKCGNIIRFLENLHKDYGPIATFYMGPNRVVSIASPEYFQKTSASFDRPLFMFDSWVPLMGKQSIHVINGPEARERLTMYNRIFSGQGLKNLLPIFNQSADQVASTWSVSSQKGDAIEVLPPLLTFTRGIIVQGCLGSYFEDAGRMKHIQDTFEKLWSNWNKALETFPCSDTFAEERFHTSMKILRDTIHQALGDSSSDATDKSMRKFRDLILPGDEKNEKKVDDMVTLMVAGTHNISYMVLWSIFFLAKYPEVQEKVYQEIMKELGYGPLGPENMWNLSYTMQVVKETIRICINPLSMREAASDMDLGGHHVPAKTALILALFKVHHDPRVFPEPERFDPDRFSSDNIAQRPKLSFEPFGFAGKRLCLGQKLSELAALVLLTTLVRKFKVTLASDEEPETTKDVILHPKKDIMVKASFRV